MSLGRQQQSNDLEGASAEGLSTKAIEDPSNVVVDIGNSHQQSGLCTHTHISCCLSVIQAVANKMTARHRQSPQNNTERDHRMVQVQFVVGGACISEFCPGHHRQVSHDFTTLHTNLKHQQPCTHVKSGACVAGQFVTALWVFVPRLTFPNSCLATVFYSVGMVMVSQNGHIGSRLKAMVIIPGGWWIGTLCGGITVSLALRHLDPTFFTPEYLSCTQKWALELLLSCMLAAQAFLCSQTLPIFQTLCSSRGLSSFYNPVCRNTF